MKNNVAKFGGSSVASKNAIDCVKKIVFEKSSRRIIVVSAFGKKDKNDEKLTNLLLECVIKKQINSDFEDEFKKIENKIKILCEQLKIKYNYKRQLKKIKKQFYLTNNVDEFISRGEYITGKIISKYLNIPFIDAKYFMFFDNFKPNYLKISNTLKKILKNHKKIIIPGFYGINNDKDIFVFSRGGSDITGAIVAKSVNSNLYENFTDVDGVMPICPSVFKTKDSIKKLSIPDLKIMTKYDAKVLHEDCPQILETTKTKLKILSTFNKGKGGTIITKRQIKNDFICHKNKGEFCLVYIKIYRSDKLKIMLKFSKDLNLEIIEKSCNHMLVKVRNDIVKPYMINCFKTIRNLS